MPHGADKGDVVQSDVVGDTDEVGHDSAQLVFAVMAVVLEEDPR